MKRKLSFAALLFVFIITSVYAQKSTEADAIVGVWLVESKDAKVQIFKVDNKYDGKIVWLKNPTYDDGTEKVDKENPDQKLQKRPIFGLKMLKGFIYDEDNEWEDGEIYDPKSGKTYSCNMTLSADSKTLEVRGYIGISLFGRTSVWTRSKL